MQIKSHVFSNVLFVISIILLLLLIAFTNYKIDPYKVFDNNENLKLYNFHRDLYYPAMKLDKKKYDYVIIGSSSIVWLFDNNYYKKKIANLSLKRAVFQEIDDLLCYFLELHPETKTVFFPFEYFVLISPFEYSLPKYSPEITIEEIFRLLFSVDTSVESLKQILGIKKQKFIERKDIWYNSTRRNYNSFAKYDENKARSIFYQKIKLIKKLQKKKINIVIYTPPYHALYLAQLYQSEYYKIFEEMKKEIVKETGVLYEMAYINEYTTKPIKNSYTYFDVIHPSPILGTYFYDYFFGNKEYKDFIIKLTNKNIDIKLKEERQKLDEYIKANKEIIEKYNKYDPSESGNDFFYNEKISINDQTQEIKTRIGNTFYMLFLD